MDNYNQNYNFNNYNNLNNPNQNNNNDNNNNKDSEKIANTCFYVWLGLLVGSCFTSFCFFALRMLIFTPQLYYIQYVLIPTIIRYSFIGSQIALAIGLCTQPKNQKLRIALIIDAVLIGVLILAGIVAIFAFVKMCEDCG